MEAKHSLAQLQKAINSIAQAVWFAGQLSTFTNNGKHALSNTLQCKATGCCRWGGSRSQDCMVSLELELVRAQHALPSARYWWHRGSKPLLPSRSFLLPGISSPASAGTEGFSPYLQFQRQQLSKGEPFSSQKRQMCSRIRVMGVPSWISSSVHCLAKINETMSQFARFCVCARGGKTWANGQRKSYLNFKHGIPPRLSPAQYKSLSSLGHPVWV